MLLTAHQPNFLPYLGFFDKILAADRFLIVDHVQFVKRGPFGWIHRNRIRTPGEPGWQWLTVPVLTKGRFEQSIREVRIDPDSPWRRKHLRALEVHYARAPHYAAYAREIADVYQRPVERLTELCEALLELALRVLDRPLRLERTSEMGITEHGTDLILAMCRATGADAYLSGVHGRDHLDVERIRRAGIDLRFQEFAHPAYPQAQPGTFVPNLCWLDFAFCRGAPGFREFGARASPGAGARAGAHP
jgi:hypothetical protein